eukprot:FR736256.1.p4 GENE.FR736256.1~~FR736256.1.p4  ORF type:complete len:101 (-),score=35.44 FR736256.1:696-998(-)
MRGKKYSKGNTIGPGLRQGGQLALHKREQKVELPPRRGPALDVRDPLGFETLGVIHCGRFFFFFFFFLLKKTSYEERGKYQPSFLSATSSKRSATVRLMR